MRAPRSRSFPEGPVLKTAPFTALTVVQTEAAASRIKDLLGSKPSAAGIKLGVKTREWRAFEWRTLTGHVRV